MDALPDSPRRPETRQGRLFAPEVEPEPWDVDELGDRLLAEVAFPEAPFGPYDYLVPEKLRDRVALGRRVRAPLGKGERTLVGYCVGLGPAGQQPPNRVLRELESVVDAAPLAGRGLEAGGWAALSVTRPAQRSGVVADPAAWALPLPSGRPQDQRIGNASSRAATAVGRVHRPAALSAGVEL